MKTWAQRGALGAIFGLFCLLLTHPQTAAQGAREGLALCAEVVIPALFPFLALSSMAVSLGAAGLLGRLLRPLVRPLFRMGEGGASALALGLMGGYPVGAQTVRELWEQGKCAQTEAERALAFCNNCGPAFVLGAAGAGVFHSPAMGALLLAGQWLGTCSVGLAVRWFGAGGESRGAPSGTEQVSLAGALTRGIHKGLLAVGNVCAYTVFFRVVVRLLEETGAASVFSGLPNGEALFTGLLDLTGGVSGISAAEPLAAELAAFLMGFGGLSVLCQSVAVLEESGLRLWPLLVGKLLHGVFAAFWTHLLLRLLPPAALASVAAGPVPIGGGSGALPFDVALWAILWGGWAVFICFHSGKRRGKRV